MMQTARAAEALIHFGFGTIVGIAGGLIGLGGAEFRLPYLVGVAGLSARRAVVANLAISLVTVISATIFRAANLPLERMLPYLFPAVCLAAGAVGAAFIGVGLLRHISDRWLTGTILMLLSSLGAALIVEAILGLPEGRVILHDATYIAAAAFAFGIAIGLISSLLGVAGGEVIIPTLVLGFAVPFKLAGSLSLLISIPTVLAGLSRFVARGELGPWRSAMPIILPMGAGSVVGAAAGGLLVGTIPPEALKLVLGCVLTWSAWRAFGHRRPWASGAV
jgi:uncharacterized membrane protein YfcA